MNASACCFGGDIFVDAESFQAAFVNHRRATFHLHNLQSLGVSVDSSPLRVCPICSPRPEEGMRSIHAFIHSFLGNYCVLIPGRASGEPVLLIC